MCKCVSHPYILPDIAYTQKVDLSHIGLLFNLYNL